MSSKKAGRNKSAQAQRATVLSARKRYAFAGIALALPFLIFALLELGLRLGGYGGKTPLFEAPEAFGGRYLAPGENVGRRFFPAEQYPPTPPNDVFLTDKPQHGIRIFALGESSTAGFPYPPNAMFTRLVEDALSDVLPGDTVEVINLGIAATNSYALVDFVDEVLEQKPDAILIYSGHNEYYGALGIGSTESLGGYPGFVRLYLNLQRLKTFLLLRNALNGALSLAFNRSKSDESSPSRMESVARDQRIELGGRAYRAGAHQYASNLAVVLKKFQDAGVPVFVGSLVSNIRDQRPLALLSGSGAIAVPATAAFDSAKTFLAAGDSLRAKTLFERARDMDVVRFRAPQEFNTIVRRLASEYSAHYVPVAETFAGRSQGGIPGSDLILEHVHPNSHGYSLLGETFLSAIRSSGVFRRADFARLRPWPEYERRMSLTAIDERIALHEVRTVTTRWPFVPFNRQQDYRGTYKPADKLDSLAFNVSRGGITWTQAKSQLAEFYQQTGKIDEAVSEYDGLIRNFPHSEPPLSLAARALLSAKQSDRAVPYLQRAISIHPTGYNTFALGVISLRKRDATQAIGLLEKSLRIAPRNPDAMYQLSLAYAFAKNAEAARSTALGLYQIAPGYPGLVDWLATLGLQQH